MAAQGAHAIGDLTLAGALDDFTNKAAHAIAGCMVGAARADSASGCAAGALGAAIGELAAEGYGRRDDTVQFAALMSGLAVAVTGGDASQINLASQAGSNAAANNYLSHSPFANVRGIVATENARLAARCGADCTQADFDRIDAQMQQLDRAAQLVELSRHSGLTTEQALRLGENIASLLPVYGTPIALYQALTGESLTGQNLTTVERFFNGVAAAVPLGSAAYRLINGAMADLRLAASFGGFGADGKALMDFGQLSSHQKGIVGELLGANTVQNVLPGATRLGRMGEVGSNGIDDLYKVTSANADYVIVEYKFGTSTLGKTADGLQMSDGWVLGSNRLIQAAGSEAEAALIRKAFESGRVEKRVVHTDPAGGTSVWLVDAAGKVVKADSNLRSMLLGAKK
ncbi:hypothetical protein H4CHR_02372 [Variovorax sp. PBS-H4]|nr:hypothetical protein H4CHR_02372 [Variovorax sp. PBS-H4]